MGIHLHRKLTAIIIALFMLTSFQAPAAFGAEEDITAAQENQQTEETAEPGAKAETEAPSEEAVAVPAKESAPPENVNTQSSAAQPSTDTEEAKGNNENAHQTIEISFALLGETKEETWIEENTISLSENSTVKDAIEKILKEADSECNFSDDGAIRSISLKIDDNTITLAAGENGNDSKWICRINGKDYEDGLDKYELTDKDKVLVYYAKTPEEMMNEEEADSSEDEPRFNALVHTTAGQSVDNAYGNTKDKLIGVGDLGNWNNETTWIVLALARSGSLTEDQAESYRESIKAIINKRGTVKLSDSISSDNSKAVLALTASGYDPSDINGNNLLEPLSNIGFIRAQGINGPIWALLAFDCRGYDIPKLDTGNETTSELLQTTRPKLISAILSGRKSDGGWAYSGSTSDVDMTAMAIQALAPYYNSDENVKAAVDGALAWLASVQNSDGSFSSGGVVTSESASQVIVALTSLGIDPTKDPRFLRNGKGAVDSLMSFYVKGGGFKHIYSNYKYNTLASMQGYYALVAYYRNINGKNSLYNMTDVGDGFVIEVEYKAEKEDENNGAPNSDSQKNGGSQVDGKKTELNPLGATKGITKSAGLIKLKGVTENAKKSLDIIEAVVKRGLSGDASTYTEDDIKAISDAYKMYLDLQPAEKLAVEKDKNWKKFCKLTDALGKIYHIDRDDGVDVLDNNDVVMPWYVRLVVREQDITSGQSKKIGNLLEEESQIFGTCDISFTNTLDTDESGKEVEWHPSNILKVNMGVPDSLDNNPIIIHIKDEGKIEFLDNEVVSDEENRYEFYDKYAQFQSDDFSIYGMASTSGSIKQMISRTNEEEEAPSDYLIWIYIGLAALAALALVMILRRRATVSKESDE